MTLSRRIIVGAIVVLAIVGSGLFVAFAQDAPKAPAVPEGVQAVPKARPAKPDIEARKAEKARLREADARRAARAGVASPPAIAVGGEYVYVVRGNWLYQFSVDGLKLVAKAQIEERAPREAGKRRAIKERVREGREGAEAKPEAR